MPIPLLSVTADPLDVQAVVRRAEQEAGEGRHGAVGVFIGNVRGENLGRRVVELHYEAYEPLALNAFAHDRRRSRRGMAGRRLSRSGTGSAASPSATPAS